MSTTPSATPAPKKTWKRRLWLGFLVAVFLTAPIRGVLFVRKYVLGTFRVPSGSMTPTLRVGETVLCLKPSSSRAPERGGVRVFAYPRDRSRDFVSRVVGVAGDRVRVLPDGSVERNGAALRRCALGQWPGDTSREAFMEADGARRYVVLQRRAHDSAPGEHCVAEACTVPAGHALVVGDDRDNSFDGRYWGFVPNGNFRSAPRLVWRAAPGTGREWSNPQATPAAPSGMQSRWADCLDRLR